MARTTRTRKRAQTWRGAIRATSRHYLNPQHRKSVMQVQSENPALVELGSVTEVTQGVPWVPAVEDLMGEDHRD